MQRRYEFMDLIVTIGLCAAIVTGGLYFMVANGSWPTKTVGSESMSQATGSLTGMEWVQPVLSQAIVDYTVLERNYTKAASAATIQLDGLILERNRWQNSPYGYLDSIRTGAAGAEADHVARDQTVMGYSIVNFTRRGFRSGLWSSVERAGPDHLVANAAAEVSLSGASPRIPTTMIVVAASSCKSLLGWTLLVSHGAGSSCEWLGSDRVRCIGAFEAGIGFFTKSFNKEKFHDTQRAHREDDDSHQTGRQGDGRPVRIDGAGCRKCPFRKLKTSMQASSEPSLSVETLSRLGSQSPQNTEVTVGT